MGVATIMILLCHASATWTTMPYFLKRILGIGNVGVDLFLLLSGIGISFSLSKIKNNRGLLKWYKKRYLRILIPYTIIMLPSLLYVKFSTNQSWLDFFLHFSTVDFWLNHRGAWYIAMLLPLYLLSPLLFECIHRFKNTIVPGIILIMLLYCFSLLPCLGNSSVVSIIKNLQTCCLRIPAFIFGMLLFPYVREHKTITNKCVVTFVLICFVLMAFLRVLGPRYEFPLLILIPLVICLLLIMSHLKSRLKFLAFMGTISLESYLTNVYLALPIKDCNHIIFNDSVPDYLVYLLIILIGIGISVLVHQLSNTILNRMSIAK